MRPREFDNYGDAARYMRDNEIDSMVVAVGDEVAHLYGNKYRLLSVGGVAVEAPEKPEAPSENKPKRSPKKKGPTKKG